MVDHRVCLKTLRNPGDNWRMGGNPTVVNCIDAQLTQTHLHMIIVHVPQWTNYRLDSLEYLIIKGRDYRSHLLSLGPSREYWCNNATKAIELFDVCDSRRKETNEQFSEFSNLVQFAYQHIGR